MIVDPRDFTPEALRKVAPKCAECDGAVDNEVTLVDGSAIYPNRPDLWTTDGVERWWWRCECGAYVGTHKGTITPLGTPCGDETRKARIAAHAAFDPLWRKRMALSDLSQTRARGRGYKWLAAQLGISPKECHIGMMDAATAWRVVEVIKQARGAA